MFADIDLSWTRVMRQSGGRNATCWTCLVYSSPPSTEMTRPRTVATKPLELIVCFFLDFSQHPSPTSRPLLLLTTGYWTITSCFKKTMAPTSQGQGTMGAVMPAAVGSSGLNLAAINLDPSLLAVASGTSSTPLDPALFTIEQVVNDVREGRIGPDDLRDEPKPADHSEEGVSEPVIEEESHPHAHAQQEPEPEPETELQLDDDGIDPALREIVNSLTNAQQVS